MFHFSYFDLKQLGLNQPCWFHFHWYLFNAWFFLWMLPLLLLLMRYTAAVSVATTVCTTVATAAAAATTAATAATASATAATAAAATATVIAMKVCNLEHFELDFLCLLIDTCRWLYCRYLYAHTRYEYAHPSVHPWIHPSVCCTSISNPSCTVLPIYVMLCWYCLFFGLFVRFVPKTFEMSMHPRRWGTDCEGWSQGAA